MLMERYAPAHFAGQEDFEANFRVSIPENFNFTIDCIEYLAAAAPDKRALVWVNDKGEKEIYTFSQVAERAAGAACYFASLGIGKGDAVMLMLKRRAQFWFALLGLIRLGALAVPATHQLTARDIIYRNNAASIAAIVAVDDEEVMAAAEASLAHSPTLRRLVKLGEKPRHGWQIFDAGARRTGDAPPRATQNSDNMLLYFTSGTTGQPKMVLHSQTYPLAHIVTARYWQNLHPGSLHLTVADTGWAKAAWGKIFGQWLCEAAVFVYDHDYFDAKKLLEQVARHRVTSLCAPPTILRYLVRLNFDAYDLSALEWVTTAGEPLNPEVSRLFKQKTGLDIREGYGQTETPPLIFTTPYMRPRYGLLGRPNPALDVKLLFKDGAQSGEAGEICVFDRQGGALGLFAGYMGEESRGPFGGDGIYHTGDLAVCDADGYYRFVARDDDVIKVASYRIGPFEVESVLMEHPAVLECAVTGEPDAKRGQTVKASVVLCEGYVPSGVLAAELQQFVKDNTAAYKYPRVVEFVSELPKTISGKVRRVQLRRP